LDKKKPKRARKKAGNGKMDAHPSTPFHSPFPPSPIPSTHSTFACVFSFSEGEEGREMFFKCLSLFKDAWKDISGFEIW